MTRNSRGRKPRAGRPSDDGPEFRIHDVRRAYKRPHQYEEWDEAVEGEEMEEIEDFDDLSDIEEDDLEVPEGYIGMDEEDHT